MNWELESSQTSSSMQAQRLPEATAYKFSASRLFAASTAFTRKVDVLEEKLKSSNINARGHAVVGERWELLEKLLGQRSANEVLW